MSESAYNSPLPLRRFTESCCSSPAKSLNNHPADALTDSDGEGDLFVETPGPPEQTIIAGWLKFRDNKKWKQRWGVVTKLSPAAGVNGEVKYNGWNITDCNPPNSTYRIWGRTKIVKDELFVKINFTMREDCGNDNYMVIKVDRVVGNVTQRLLNLKHPGVCAGITTYGGTAYADVAQHFVPPIDPKLCPIPQADYKLNWYKVDAKKAPIVRLVPRGRYFIHLEDHRADESERIICVEFYAEIL